MERKVGEVFTYDGVRLKVVEGRNPLSCAGCYLYDEGYDCGNVSGEYKPKVALFLDDAGDAHCPGEAHHGDDAQSDGKLVANHLCT